MIFGKLLDDQSRCEHYHSSLDVIAIKFKCCNNWYACYYCHEELAGHPAEPWPESAYYEYAICCGVCGNKMRITDYLNCGNVCPQCGAQFNPKCVNHYPLYFESFR